jgi:hypothetical protein
MHTPLVRRLTRSYTRSLAPEYIFTRDEFHHVLDNAVHFVQNHLVRPRWMLEQFIFEESDRVGVALLQDKLEWFTSYPYYSRTVIGYLARKEMREMDRAGFSSLLGRIDQEVVGKYGPVELAALTRPIFDFLRLHPETVDTAIPLKPLVVFFEDKKMTDLSRFLEETCSARGINNMTLTTLQSMLEERMVSGDASQPEHAVAPGDELSGSGEPERPSVTARDPSQPDRRNIPLSLTFSGMLGRDKESALPDLHASIASEARERFVRTIFQKDAAYYTVVINSLNSMATWGEASFYLQNFYHTNGLDPFSADVIDFTDAVQARFTPSLTRQ